MSSDTSAYQRIGQTNVSRETLITQREGVVSRETSGEEVAFLKKLFGKGFFLISACQAPMML